MHITLIRSAMVIPRWAVSSPTCPPLGMAYVAAALRKAGHDVFVIDTVGEGLFQYLLFRPGFIRHGLADPQILQRVPPESQAIGISIMCSQDFPPVKALLRELRRNFPKAFLFAGGEHPTAQPEEMLSLCPELDAVVVGEGEATVVDLFSELSLGGDLRRVKGVVSRHGMGVLAAPRRARLADVDDIPLPAWDLFNLAPYLENGLGIGVKQGRTMPILASRGCPFECTFCSNPVMWGPVWTPRSPAKVLEEMIGYTHRYGADNFDFYDLTAIINRAWIVEFTRSIIASGRRFTWQLPIGTRAEVLDDEVLGLLYESGCRFITYAPESGSPSLLKHVKKRLSVPAIQRSMKAAVQQGLNVRANMVFGFPGETHLDRWRSFALIAKMAWMGVHDVYINTFVAYPGSEIFEEIRRNGRISNFDDDYYYSIDCQVLFTSKSWSDTLGKTALTAYRVFGIALFFLLSLLLRPYRFAPILTFFSNKRQGSKLEKSLVDMSRRFFRARKALEA